MECEIFKIGRRRNPWDNVPVALDQLSFPPDLMRLLSTCGETGHADPLRYFRMNEPSCRAHGAWPWLVIILDRDYPIAGSVAKARWVKQCALMSSHRLLATGEPHPSKMVVAGIIMIRHKPVLRDLADRLDFLQPVWQAAEHCSPAAHWVCVAGPLARETISMHCSRCAAGWAAAAARSYQERETYLLAGRDLTLLAAVECMVQRNHEAVIHYLERHLKRRQSRPEPEWLLALADAWLRVGQPGLALRVLDGLAARVPAWDRMHRLTGDVLTALKKPAGDVDAAYGRAVRHNPHNFHAREMRGRLRYREQRFAAAAEDFLCVADYVPWEAKSWIELAYTLFYAGRAAEAEDAFREYARLHLVTEQWLLNSVAMCRIAMGRADEAVPLAERAVAADGADDPNYLHTLGLAYLRTGRVRDAFHLFERALQRNPDHPESLEHRREALQRLGGPG